MDQPLAFGFLPHERAMLRILQKQCLQKYAAVHASAHEHFYLDVIPGSWSIFEATRTAALSEWRAFGAAQFFAFV